MLEKKVLEYQKNKAEREAAFEREQERQRIEKEREVARLRALQERARDEQAERDALRAKRAQEQSEREWRKKEAEEARQKVNRWHKDSKGYYIMSLCILVHVVSDEGSCTTLSCVLSLSYLNVSLSIQQCR